MSRVALATGLLSYRVGRVMSHDMSRVALATGLLSYRV